MINALGNRILRECLTVLRGRGTRWLVSDRLRRCRSLVAGIYFNVSSVFKVKQKAVSAGRSED